MIEKTTTVKNPTGLHARPASQLVKLCKQYASTITITGDGRSCDAKSIFSVLHACLKQGTEIVIAAEGPDEEKAVQEIAAYIDGLEE